MENHEIIVGNIGTAYKGNNKNDALECYNGYVKLSESDYGRCANETVTWLIDDEIYMEMEV